MSKFFLIPALAVALLTSCVDNPDGKKASTTDSTEIQQAATGASYTVDAAASKVEWKGKKVSGEHFGTVNIKSGSLLVDNGVLTGGNFVIDLNTISSTDLEGEWKEKLDGHLKAADFFDTEKFPEATFQITEAKQGSTTADYVISGNLTIKGVSKNITFDAKVAEATDASVKVDADFNIAREDWGVNYEGKQDDLISKEINFKISLVAKK